MVRMGCPRRGVPLGPSKGVLFTVPFTGLWVHVGRALGTVNKG